MQPNNKLVQYKKSLDEIDLKNEESYKDYMSLNLIQKANKKKALRTRKKKNIWLKTIEKYLNSVNYAFQKGNKTTKKVSDAFDNIPEPTSKKFFFCFTTFFGIIVLIIFLFSCKANAQSTYQKNQERLFIKRENIIIKSKENGSTTGSIWADSPEPKSLITDYQPSRTGQIIHVNIPKNLQYTNSDQNPTNGQKSEAIESVKFEIVNFEPGGDVYLRGVKNYLNEIGAQHDIMIMAKLPQRKLTKFKIDANDLTQVTVSDNNNGSISDYSSLGWDSLISKKISGYTPNINTALKELENQKKDLETQKKSLQEQQKSLAEDAQRLKSDRDRLNLETTQAQKILDSAIVQNPESSQKENDKNEKTNKKQNNETKNKQKTNKK
jgi:hypothetical protein